MGLFFDVDAHQSGLLTGEQGNPNRQHTPGHAHFQHPIQRVAALLQVGNNLWQVVDKCVQIVIGLDAPRFLVDGIVYAVAHLGGVGVPALGGDA